MVGWTRSSAAWRCHSSTKLVLRRSLRSVVASASATPTTSSSIALARRSVVGTAPKAWTATTTTAASLSSSSSSSLSSSSSFRFQSTATAAPSQLTPQEQVFYEQGIVDDHGLTLFDTLHEMQVRSCQVFADRELFGTYSPNSKQFEWMTYADFADKVNTCRVALKDLGISEYDKIGLISNNRWEWACIAAAAYSLKAVPVPMYEAQLPADWTYILNDSGAKLLFCATQDIFDRVQQQVAPSVPAVQEILCFDAAAGEPHAFATIMELTQAKSDTEGQLIITPSIDDLADLIYTSGTTGKPKGVELTHGNFTSNAKAAARSLVKDPREMIRRDDRSLAFLPWAHSYGQTLELWASMAHGSSMGICRGVPLILEDLQMVKPTLLFAVPTLFKKIYDGVHNMIQTSSPIRKQLMTSALEIGAKKVHAASVDESLGLVDNVKFKVLDKLVLSKIRARFGGRLRTGYVGGAACPAEVLQFMDSLGIPVCEGYGLTETSPLICLNTPEQRKVGSVGRAIGGVTVYIVDEEGRALDVGQEGEICCTGPNVMHGYYKNPAATEEVISIAPDGKSRMFHTGDLGRMGEDGFLSVTGRVKELYKLENGKYVVPTPIEDKISLSRFITQVVLVGANRPYNTALLVPEWPVIRAHLKIADSVSDEELANDERVKQLIDSEVQTTCQKMKKYEVPHAWALVAPFTAANGMLTPKMSIRRHKVVEAYADVIALMYGDEPKDSRSSTTDSATKDHGEKEAVA